MAPVCTNCGGNEFVWAGELKTGGRFGQGPLSLRSGGELPLGTRICRGCGHADLFLRDVTILQAPHHWRPGEFVPISAPASGHHSRHSEPAPSTVVPARAPSPPAPAPEVALAPAPPPPPEPPALTPPLLPPPEPELPSILEEPLPPEPAPAPAAAPAREEPEPKRSAPRRRPARSKKSST
jgi:hypothetical protein